MLAAFVEHQKRQKHQKDPPNGSCSRNVRLIFSSRWDWMGILTFLAFLVLCKGGGHRPQHNIPTLCDPELDLFPASMQSAGNDTLRNQY